MSVGIEDVRQIGLAYAMILTGVGAYKAPEWWMALICAVFCYGIYRLLGKLDGTDTKQSRPA